MSKQLSLSAHASALALVLLVLTGAVGDLRSGSASSAERVTPLSVSALAN